MKTTHLTEYAKIMDKDGVVLHEAPAREAFEWVVRNPVGPHKVKLEGTREPLTIDDWCDELDRLNEQY